MTSRTLKWRREINLKKKRYIVQFSVYYFLELNCLFHPYGNLDGKYFFQNSFFGYRSSTEISLNRLSYLILS